MKPLRNKAVESYHVTNASKRSCFLNIRDSTKPLEIDFYIPTNNEVSREEYTLKDCIFCPNGSKVKNNNIKLIDQWEDYENFF